MAAAVARPASAEDLRGITRRPRRYVYFVEGSGAVWKVDVDGENPTELLDYCDGGSCEGLGLDSWDYTEKLYYVDAKLGELMSCNMHTGDDALTLVTDLTSAYAVAVDKKAGKVYVTADGGVYYTDYQTEGASFSEMSTYGPRRRSRF